MSLRIGVTSFFALCCLIWLPFPDGGRVEAQSPATQIIAIERGDALRSKLLDAARPTFVAETDGDVEFVVRRLTVWGPWAYAQVLPQRPGGAPIDWSRTIHAERHAQGDLDGNGESYVLLVRHSGDWQVHEFAIGPTDVVWAGWVDEYYLPAGLFAD